MHTNRTQGQQGDKQKDFFSLSTPQKVIWSLSMKPWPVGEHNGSHGARWLECRPWGAVGIVSGWESKKIPSEGKSDIFLCSKQCSAVISCA